MNERKHVELFAGCGGMAIGMESAGFKLEFANELSPMAANTFAHNVLGESLENKSKKVKWIHTKYSKKDFDNRLRENLLIHENLENCELEINNNLSDFKDNLLVGDVRKLLKVLLDHKISNPYNDKLDLISGGPPCQSFSLAGKREKENYKNRLPLDFAEICEILNPKVVLLENVKGILSAFTDEGVNYYAWFEVAKTFALKGYAPICMLINSKYFGIPQNRPRYIMIGLRKDIFVKLKKKRKEHPIILMVDSFIKKLNSDIDSVNLEDLKFFDIERELDLFDGDILPKPSTPSKSEWISVENAIDDLSNPYSKVKSNYVKKINTIINPSSKSDTMVFNHHVRKHSDVTKNRFLFYQLLNHCPENKNRLIRVLTSFDSNKSMILKKSYEELILSFEKAKFLFPNFNQWKDFINNIKLTKKHSQRALMAELPSPAQLTIPDDICHYSIDQPRVLTVREIARIQSFPDWFEFKSKVTTGGKSRSYEVPQYTQVGNAVPPKLALILGTHINNLLNIVNE